MAAEAKTLGELAELVEDLQRPTDAPLPPTPPKSNRRRWYLISVTAASVCAAVATFTLISGATTADPAPAAPAAAPAPDRGPVQPVVVATPNLLTREGITHFLRKYREKGVVLGESVVGADLIREAPSLGHVSRWRGFLLCREGAE